MYILSLLILILALSPEQASAWGGGAHLQAGITILDSLNLMPAKIAALLASYPKDYLYGCIAADIIVGKKYTHYLLNCHRWSSGFSVLDAAKSDGEKACAYGYLSHLAADVIAHNYFVPYKIMRSFATVTMKHAYWEMRFETFVDKSVWEQAKQVCHYDQSRNDALLRSVLAKTIFPFGVNKRIFNSIMLLSRLEKWQQMMQALSDNSRYALVESDSNEYLLLLNHAVADFLQKQQKSKFFLADPTGNRALTAADAVRKNLRMLYKSGRISKEEGLEQLENVRSKLKDALHKPELLEELYVG